MSLSLGRLVLHPMSKLSQRGFTLLEILVVLSIWITILAFSVPFTITLLEKKTEEHILNTFQQDVLYIQNQAIGSKEYLRIILHKNSYIMVGANNKTEERKLPSGWTINRRTIENISFNQKGSIREAGTIQFITPNNRYNIIFPIGKGRGYIEKQ